MFKRLISTCLLVIYVGCDDGTRPTPVIPNPGTFTSLYWALRSPQTVRYLEIINDSLLTELPPEIETLANLTGLEIRYTKLHVVPSQIGSLTELTYMLLSDNHIDSVDARIGSLTKLEKLALGRNRLQRLPSEIGNLVRLKYLYLPNNNLDSLPSTVVSLTKLIRLDVSGNKMSPEYITMLHTWFPNAEITY